MFLRTLLFVLAFTATVATSSSAVACDYDSCALRVQSGWFSESLVAGVDNRQVAKLSLFQSNDVRAILAERSETSAGLFDQYRSKQRKGSVLYIAGAGLLVASFFNLEDGGGYSDAGWAYAISGAVVAMVGGWIQSSARDKLSSAVWEYNRTLPAN